VRACTLGKAETAEFGRLYTAPGVDHVGSGAPCNVDMLGVLVDWVEKGHAPGDPEVAEQKVEAPSKKRHLTPLVGRVEQKEGRPWAAF
jgi:Tannase and feruloyl esterase